jgi:PTS system nitrogen regulatory IIA component
MNPKTLASVFGSVILLDVSASDKKDILSTLVAAVSKRHRINKKQQSLLLSKVIAREELGSTGIGSGAAVPHAKIKGVSRLLGAFARTAEPLDYDAVDGEPVQLVFLLLSPEDAATGYLEALSALSRAIRDKKFCNFLRTAKNKKDLLYTLNEIELRPVQGG